MSALIAQLDLDFFCVIVLIILILSMGSKVDRRLPDFRLYGFIVISTLTMLALDAFAWVLDGRPGAANHAALVALNTLYFAVHPMPELGFFLYAEYRVFEDDRRFRKKARGAAIFFFAMLAATLINVRTGWIFTIDGMNRYARGYGFAAHIAATYAPLFLTVFFVYRHRKSVAPADLIPLMAFPLPTVVGGILQNFFLGISFFWAGTTVSILIIFLQVQNRIMNRDYLTGVYNRKFLDEYLAQKIRNLPDGSAFAGFFVDLDDFKSINDRFGHEVGDQTLIAAARILGSTMRAADIIARYAGDEFIALLDVDNDGMIDQIRARLQDEISRFNGGGTIPGTLSMSIGAAVFSRGADTTAARFLKRLDAEMYAEKTRKKAQASVERRYP